MNKSILIGRLTKEPEIKKSKDGKSIAKITLAVDRYPESVDFIPCTAFGKTADVIGQYAVKGQKVGIDGSLRTGKYEDQNGTTHYTYEVIIERLELLDRPKNSQQSMDTQFNDIDTGDVTSEDLPF